MTYLFFRKKYNEIKRITISPRRPEWWGYCKLPKVSGSRFFFFLYDWLVPHC